jgi:hypothetical protein
MRNQGKARKRLALAAWVFGAAHPLDTVDVIKDLRCVESTDHRPRYAPWH